MVQVHVQTKQTYKERKKKKKDGRNGAASAWREKWAKGREREREREIMQHKVEGSSCMWHKYRILRECLDSSEDDGKVDPTKRT